MNEIDNILTKELTREVFLEKDTLETTKLSCCVFPTLVACSLTHTLGSVGLFAFDRTTNAIMTAGTVVADTLKYCLRS